ncbi:hypothetical protein GobsT_00600 [Gemmata obscuriglobus]|uniref:Uncharacterized protein n=1 Tax=Gemmata obscuriglobus TaxID=114 RepID=A0A2Z3HHM9_9BACT|nr:DUF6404 family protein [Gemmata obscuriglobus]AWM41314.1 hypothetical protein C1280_32840 [Gemmata obscuriglobus]QEG25336.1 hypothetical protein GobsT_00600 [Gemmata obscuriglobus]VTR98270.1 Uncharacterized protein OS=mine drainage metagenome GN=B1A_11421 PE=4 SV=1 [Gemmata obscuriglobus UQM 2246]
MTEREKIDTAVEYLKGQRIAAHTAAPLLWRLCWRAGFLIPPPHFLTFLPVALLTGVPLGIGLNVAVIVLRLLVGKPLAWPLAMVGVSGAILFGSLSAVYYRWSASRLGLPKWSAFHPDFDAPEESW